MIEYNSDNVAKIFRRVIIFKIFRYIGGLLMKSDFTLKLDRCKGCGICVNFCPKKVLALDTLGKVYVAHPEDCIACGQCELRCPDYAIFVDKVKEASSQGKGNKE